MLTRLAPSAAIVLTLTTAVMPAEPETFGAGVSLSATTPIGQVIEHPGTYEGKTIRVDGTVTAVCAHMGCWMALAPSDVPEAGRTLLLKVDDGVIVFPISAKGRRVSAQGVIERAGGDAESREAAAEHARQTGAPPPEPAAVTWQLKATGAILY